MRKYLPALLLLVLVISIPTEALAQRATHVVDLHAWNRFWAASTLRWEGADSAKMADVAGTRFTWWHQVHSTPASHTQIRNTVVGRGGSAVCIEFAGQNCVYEREVQVGVRAMCNMAKVLGMMEGEPEIPPDCGLRITDDDTTVVRAPCSGLFVEHTK